MVQFNFSERTVRAKVVYYGPAQSGKTTNLEQIHRVTDPEGLNRLISLNTAQDRTLFFDLLPISLGAVSGYDFKIQLYTVPGQVQYNATRRVVLAGADAVVFVADGRRSMAKENLSAFENMKVNLLANRLVPEKIPLVFQYNKQDLPDVQGQEELDRSLNPWSRRSFLSVASRGEGVVETFAAVVEDMLVAIAAKYSLKDKGLDPESVPAIVAEAFTSLVKAPPQGPSSGAEEARAPAKILLRQPQEQRPAAPPQGGGESSLISEELLHRAIRSNVELAETLSDVVREMNMGLGSILSQAELLSFYRDDAKEKRAAAIAVIQKEAARLRGIVQQIGSSGQPPLSARETGPRPGVSGSPSAIPSASPSAPAPGPPPPPEPAPVPRPAAVTALPPAESALAVAFKDLIEAVRPSLAPRGLRIDLRKPIPTAPPRCSPDDLRTMLHRLVSGVTEGGHPAGVLSMRCERKPVLLRTREGEVKRDFLMVAMAHAARVSPEAQQEIMQGRGSGALGDMARLARQLGGFVRFAPLPGGGLETRAFLPAGP
jgi:signal recognition particle receptor subunit beta